MIIGRLHANSDQIRCHPQTIAPFQILLAIRKIVPPLHFSSILASYEPILAPIQLNSLCLPICPPLAPDARVK